MSQFQIVHTLDEATWRRFLNGNPDSNIFHTPEMFQVFSSTRGFSPRIWAVQDQNADVQAFFLPVQITVKGGLLHSFTTRAVDFGSLLWQDDSHGIDALQFLLKSYAAETAHAPIFTELRHIASKDKVLPILEKCGFVFEPHLNYLINLEGGPEAVFQKIGSRTRKNIRHGLNRGKVIIEAIHDKQQVAGIVELLKKTYQNAQVPLPDVSLFDSAFDVLYPLGMIRFSQARIGNFIASVSVELLYRDVVYGWYGGLDRAFGNYAPNELLMWNILEWSASNGYRVYDFGGAGKPDEKYGVRDFKAKFGGDLVAFGRSMYVHKPVVLQLSKIGYSVLRRWL